MIENYDNNKIKGCCSQIVLLENVNLQIVKNFYISLNSSSWCFWLAKFYGGEVGIDELEEVVLRNREKWWCHEFAMEVEGADFDTLMGVIYNEL